MFTCTQVLTCHWTLYMYVYVWNNRMHFPKNYKLIVPFVSLYSTVINLSQSSFQVYHILLFYTYDWHMLLIIWTTFFFPAVMTQYIITRIWHVHAAVMFNQLSIYLNKQWSNKDLLYFIKWLFAKPPDLVIYR